jgi:hypothetical protein
MRFSLQDMVRNTLAEAEMREKYAQAEGETGPTSPEEKKKKEGPPASDSSGSASPETNDESLEEKTSSVFVEKLASAVAYCNKHFIKIAVGEPEPAPVATPKTTTVGPGIGTTSIPNTIDSPTKGTQSTNTGQATNNQPPLVPGSGVASPGQTNTETALETDINSPPGGSEDWSEGTDVMKQANVARTAIDKVKRLGQLMSGSQTRLMGPKTLTGENKMFKEMDAVRKARKIVGGVAAGTTATAAGALGLKKALSKENKPDLSKAAQVNRVRYILDKMAEDATNPSSIKATHNDVEPETLQAGDPVAAQPGEVSKQESFLDTVESAMNYTKQQAKAVPKARMSEVLSEPAQKKSTDPVLHENLDAASGAGVKLSSVEKAAAARVLLQKIAEEGAKEDASPEEKEKALKLQEILKSKQQEKESSACKQGSAMPISGGY